MMRQLRETDEISCRRLSDHEVSSLAADQVVAEIFIQQGELIEDRQSVNRYAVLDHLLSQPALLDTHFTALSGPLAKERRPSWCGAPQGLRDAAERAGRARPPGGRSGRPEGPNRTYGCGACPMPHMARRAAPTRRAAPPHEMGVYLRRLVSDSWIASRSGVRHSARN